MELTDLIKSRRSINVFTDQPLPPGLIEELLETAIWSPNHKLTEPWRFILITGDACREVAEIRRDMAIEWSKAPDEETRRSQGEQMYQRLINVPAFLVVYMKEDPSPHIREEDYAACCCLVQNFMLLAWERGVGSTWKTFKEHDRLRTYLGIQPYDKVVAFLHIGYPAEVPTTRRAPAQRWLTHIGSEQHPAVSVDE